MDDPREVNDDTWNCDLRQAIARLNAGDVEVRGEIINLAQERLLRVCEQQRSRYPQLPSFVSSETLVQRASQGIYQSLHDVGLRDVLHFYQLASLHLRREIAVELESCSDVPPEELQRVRRWVELHEEVDRLPDRERSVFQLTWVFDFRRDQIADLMGTSEAEVRRIWRSVRLRLDQSLS